MFFKIVDCFAQFENCARARFRFHQKARATLANLQRSNFNCAQVSLFPYLLVLSGLLLSIKYAQQDSFFFNLHFCIHKVKLLFRIKAATMIFFSFFKTLVGKEVAIELKNDVVITGVLLSVDQYLNVKLKQVNVVNSESHPQLASMKNCFIRGSAVRYGFVFFLTVFSDIFVYCNIFSNNTGTSKFLEVKLILSCFKMPLERKTHLDKDIITLNQYVVCVIVK